jgi:hypothetical protein
VTHFCIGYTGCYEKKARRRLGAELEIGRERTSYQGEMDEWTYGKMQRRKPMRCRASLLLFVGPYCISCVSVASYITFFANRVLLGLRIRDCSPPSWLPHNSSLDSSCTWQGGCKHPNWASPLTRSLFLVVMHKPSGAELLTKIPGGFRRKLDGR